MTVARNRWQLQEAKARLSEVMQRACSDGPQTITLRGKDKAVLLSADDYNRLTTPPVTLLQALLNSPIREEDLYLFERDRSAARPVDLGD